MKNLVLKIVAILGLFTIVNVHAKTIDFQGTDIGPAVNFYAKQVTPLKKSFTVYNWSPAGAAGDAVNSGIAESGSQTFWSRFGDSQGKNNMYGWGLYSAVDPILTMSYGGGSDGWLVLEMQFPVGFRMIDLVWARGTFSDVPADVKKILGDFDCPTDGVADSLFVNGGSELKSTCQALVKRIFQQELKIDGFGYGYGQTTFKECKGDQTGQSSRAFVVTDSKWIRPELLHYYTKNSTHYLERRIQIQTLFYSLAESAGNYLSNALGVLADFMEGHPNHNLMKSSNKCEGETCIITVVLCSSETACENLELRLPRPGGPLITAQSLAKIHSSYSSMGLSLLWNDLEGKPKSTMTTQWLMNNKFVCTGKLPYDE